MLTADGGGGGQPAERAVVRRAELPGANRVEAEPLRAHFEAEVDSRAALDALMHRGEVLGTGEGWRGRLGRRR